MGEVGIQFVEGGLGGGLVDWAGEQGAEVASAVAYDDDVLGGRQKYCEFVFDGLGRNFVAGVEDDQIFYAADDAPVAVFVLRALVAGVEPAVAEDCGGFDLAIPIAGENIGAAHDDFFFGGDFHFDAVDRWAHVACINHSIRIVHGTNPGRFR